MRRGGEALQHSGQKAGDEISYRPTRQRSPATAALQCHGNVRVAAPVPTIAPRARSRIRDALAIFCASWRFAVRALVMRVAVVVGLCTLARVAQSQVGNRLDAARVRR